LEWRDPDGPVRAWRGAASSPRARTRPTLRSRTSRAAAAGPVLRRRPERGREAERRHRRPPTLSSGRSGGGFVGYSRIEAVSGRKAKPGPAPGARRRVGASTLLAGARFPEQMRDRFHETRDEASPSPTGSVLFSVMDNLRAHNAFYGRGSLGCAAGVPPRPAVPPGPGARFALGADEPSSWRAYGTSIFQTPLVRVEVPRGPVRPAEAIRAVFNPSKTFDAVWRGDGSTSATRISQRLRAFVGYTFLYWADPPAGGWVRWTGVVNFAAGRAGRRGRAIPFPRRSLSGRRGSTWACRCAGETARSSSLRRSVARGCAEASGLAAVSIGVEDGLEARTPRASPGS